MGDVVQFPYKMDPLLKAELYIYPDGNYSCRFVNKGLTDVFELIRVFEQVADLIEEGHFQPEATRND